VGNNRDIESCFEKPPVGGSWRLGNERAIQKKPRSIEDWGENVSRGRLGGWGVGRTGRLDSVRLVLIVGGGGGGGWGSFSTEKVGREAYVGTGQWRSMAEQLG